MRSTPFALLALGAAVAHANILKRQYNSSDEDVSPGQEYFEEVCLPLDTSDNPDLSTPCWQVQSIEWQCIYGSETSYDQTSVSNSSGSGNWSALPPREQQLCFCDSEFWQAIDGCVACADSHGVTGAIPDFSPGAVSSFSASYCAASNTATVELADALYTGLASYITSSYPIITATTFTDPIGNKTEVSRYWTASATGASATMTRPAYTSSAPAAYTGGAAAPGAAVDRYAAAGVLGLAAVVAAL